jgi:Winged helix DNA-binding domain
VAIGQIVSGMRIRVSRDEVVRFRLHASHLDRKLPPDSFAEAAWGGLQDSVPRGGVTALHARVEGTQPDSWEDPSLVQIWFRGGADYIVPRDDVAVFTLGSLPRDPDAAGRLERLADEIHRVTDDQILKVGEVQSMLAHEDRRFIKQTSPTGRVRIRWDARDIWLIPTSRPDADPEDARLELARRFVHWSGPTIRALFGRWTGASPRDAAATWAGIENELVEVDIESAPGGHRFVLATDLDDLVGAEPVEGIRLIPFDDPLTKLDKELIVPDPIRRDQVFPPVGQSAGYIPGPILVDGEVAGIWQRQQRKVRIHPWRPLTAGVREAIETEALAFPIAGSAEPSVTWEEAQ